MLILTRRKNQKIVFPNLGITVKVVDVSGKTIRLGIDAPKEIRIVRDELEPFPTGGTNSNSVSTDTGNSSYARTGVKRGSNGKRNPLQNFSEENDRDHSAEKIDVLVRQLDSANLALHLAQNQLRQGQHEYADESLQHAIECLRKIESAADLIPTERSTSVQESSQKYTVCRKRTALLLGGRTDDQLAVAKQLANVGISVTQEVARNSLGFLSAIQTDSRPDLVLILNGSETSNRIQEHSDSTIWDRVKRIAPIKLGSLKSMTPTANVNIAGHIATVWADNDFSLADLAG